MQGNIGFPHGGGQFGAAGMGGFAGGYGGAYGDGSAPFGRPAGFPPHLFEPLLPGQAVGYPRKSTATERASKSIEDQAAEIREFAPMFGVPLEDDDIWPEAVGHGGDEFWKGGGGTGLAGDTYSQERHRPTLTRIMDAVIAGGKRAILVLSQDRLWRDVEICDAIIKFCERYKVRLYDRNGLIDIYTPEGRGTVRNNAIAAAHYREQCAVRSPIGIKRSGAKGTVITDSNTLGFRSGGRYSRKVIHVPEEQEVVRRIFAMFYHGEVRGGIAHGPMSTAQIADQLMAEGYQWTPDLHEKRGKKRNEHTRDLIYDWQVRRVLSDWRYVGIQEREDKREGRVDHWPCPAYLLPDGTTVVDPVLFERVQEKINSLKRTGGAGQTKHAMTGLLRCGVCGQGLQQSSAVVKMKNDAETYTYPYWRIVRSESWCWCTHTMPGVRADALDAYLDDVLAPLMLAELRERAEDATHHPLRAEQARVARELREVEYKLQNDLKGYVGKVSPELLGQMEQDLKGRALDLRREAGAIEERLREMETGHLQQGLENLADLTPEARRDLIRSVIRWAVVLSCDEPLPKGRMKAKRDANGLLPPVKTGYVLFLTAFGTYHTAVTERLHTGHQGQRTMGLRPARADEVLGTVMDLPDPDGFVAGLKRAFDGRKYEYNPFDLMPGFTPKGSQAPPVAEFQTDWAAESSG